MPYKAQTTRTRGGQWETSNLTFATHDEALQYAERTADISTLIADYRVVESKTEVSHTMVNGAPRALSRSLEIT